MITPDAYHTILFQVYAGTYSNGEPLPFRWNWFLFESYLTLPKVAALTALFYDIIITMNLEVSISVSICTTRMAYVYPFRDMSFGSEYDLRFEAEAGSY